MQRQLTGHVCCVLQVDNTTFATVLELCEGGDLEGHLQQFHVGTWALLHTAYPCLFLVPLYFDHGLLC